MWHINLHVRNETSSIFAKTSLQGTARTLEHQKKDCPMGEHLLECSGNAQSFELVKVKACCGVEKVITKEATDLKS